MNLFNRKTATDIELEAVKNNLAKTKEILYRIGNEKETNLKALGIACQILASNFGNTADEWAEYCLELAKK